MFSWFVSLLLLFTNHSKIVSVPSVGTSDTGNRHVMHAEDCGTNGCAPADSDGTGSGGKH